MKWMCSDTKYLTFHGQWEIDASRDKFHVLRFSISRLQLYLIIVFDPQTWDPRPETWDLRPETWMRRQAGGDGGEGEEWLGWTEDLRGSDVPLPSSPLLSLARILRTTLIKNNIRSSKTLLQHIFKWFRVGLNQSQIHIWTGGFIHINT